MFPNPVPVCGLYYTHSRQHGHGPFSKGAEERVFLPQVQLEAHASILQSTSRVTLTQAFTNPSPTKAIREVRYVFPLYEGVSVVAFTCHVADRTIVGEVKEKHEAKQDYTAAIERGETAGLFQQLDTADTFMATVGNVPPGVRVVIKLTYLGELKHDMEVDGTRFILPNIITPRYGRTAPGSDAALAQFQRYTSSRGGPSGNISVTVDVEMAEGSFIQKVLSPSHPISLSMGTTSTAPNDEPNMSKASASLGIQCTHLDTDFILQIVAKDTGLPKAILETHPTIPHQRVLMATLVPKFILSPENPEIVFICDRSGSMAGTRIDLARRALQLFLKSLPVGAMFNICSFGSSYSFLWPRSVAYSQQTLDEAVEHVRTLEANYGGTEMLQPLKATIQQRYRDIPLEVMMLTDGAILNQDSLFSYLNEQVLDTKAPIRVYSLGVGSGVSHALVEGIARAGNGFSQTVGEGEKMDSRIVRMLKGALSPHVTDYALAVKYAGSSESLDEIEDFEIVERVADSFTVKLDLREKHDIPKPIKPISLFDPSADPDKIEPPTRGASRLAHLPKVPTPKIIQAPQRIPSLFAFNRTTIYLLLGPDAPRKTPQSVILRGNSTHGPLELEFPVQPLAKPGTTIHQLAAKKATYELEQGRGWLSEAKDESGQLLRARHESRFSSMVEREAVTLGVQFQVSGKWCSFVAVENEKTSENEKTKDQWEFLEDEPFPEPTAPQGGLFGPNGCGNLSFGGTAKQPFQATNPFGSRPAVTITDGGHFGVSPGITPSLFGANPSASAIAFGAGTGASSSLFGSSGATPLGGGPFGAVSQSSNNSQGGGLFGESRSLQVSGSGSGTPGGQAGGLFGGQQQHSGGSFGQQQQQQRGGLFGGQPGLFGQQQQQQHMQQQRNGGLFGNPTTSVPQPTNTGGLFGNVNHSQQQDTQQNARGSLFAGLGQSLQQQMQQQPHQAGLFGQSHVAPPQGNHALQDHQMSLMLLEQQNKKRLLMARQELEPQRSTFGGDTRSGGINNSPPKTKDETLALFISLQRFEGAWECSPSLYLALELGEATVEDARSVLNHDLALETAAQEQGKNQQYSKTEWATAVSIVCIEKKLASLQGSWELIVDKARVWLSGSVGTERLDKGLNSARKLF